LPLTSPGAGFSLQQGKEEKKKRRKLEAASPSGEWQAAHHLRACSPNKGRRMGSCALGTNRVNPPLVPQAAEG